MGKDEVWEIVSCMELCVYVCVCGMSEIIKKRCV